MTTLVISFLLQQTTVGVTGTEVNAVLAKFDKVARKVVGLSGSTSLKSNGSKAATRFEICSDLWAIAQACEPKFKISPKAIAFEKSRIRSSNTQELALYTKMIRGGWIAPIGPLATNRLDSLTTREFGDALGYFALRLMELTQTPKTKWSPYLHG